MNKSLLGHKRETPKRVQFGAFNAFLRGASRYDIHDPYHYALSLSWKGFLAHFLALEVGINCVFASLYLAVPGAIANLRPGSFGDAFFFSLETWATVGYGAMAPATFYGHFVSATEIICGTAFTAIVTGLLFVRFSRPRPKILFADQAVVTTHNGMPTLMVRIANGRLGVLTNAEVMLCVLLFEQSAEGASFRRVHDLKLARSMLPVFALTWTLIHTIDEQSPIHGMDAGLLRDSKANVFVAIQARDHALNAQVHDLRYYPVEDIAFGMHYADVISLDGEGTPMADLTRLSMIQPDAARASQPEPVNAG